MIGFMIPTQPRLLCFAGYLGYKQILFYLSTDQCVIKSRPHWLIGFWSRKWEQQQLSDEVRGTKLKVQTRCEARLSGICCCCSVPTFLTYQNCSFVLDTMWTVLKFCFSLKLSHCAVIDSCGGGPRGEQEERGPGPTGPHAAGWRHRRGPTAWLVPCFITLQTSSPSSFSFYF